MVHVKQVDHCAIFASHGMKPSNDQVLDLKIISLDRSHLPTPFCDVSEPERSISGGVVFLDEWSRVCSRVGDLEK